MTKCVACVETTMETPNNDFTKPDGSQTDSSSQFGDSWQTDEDEDATSVTFYFS